MVCIVRDDTLAGGWRCNMNQADDEDFIDDREDPDLADQDQDDDPEQIPCPFCHKAVAENAEICPHCGNFMFSEDAPRERTSAWKWIVVIVLVIIFSGLIFFLRK